MFSFEAMLRHARLIEQSIVLPYLSGKGMLVSCPGDLRGPPAALDECRMDIILNENTWKSPVKSCSRERYFVHLPLGPLSIAEGAGDSRFIVNWDN